MKITINLNLNGLKSLVRYGLLSNTDFLGEVYYNPTDYVIISVEEQKLYITAVYKDQVLTHMADVSYATFLDLIGELDYSTNDFKEIISHYL
jgi:hypothetical protein